MRDRTFLLERITKIKELIVLYEDALAALAANPLKSYRLNTSQTDQQVTQQDIPQLNETLLSMYNQCSILEARLTGAGTLITRPVW